MIGIFDLFLVLLFLIFTVLAYVTSEAFVFGIAGIFAMISGFDIGLLSIDDVANGWAMALIGFALFLFGIFLFVAAFQTELRKGAKKQ